VGSTRASATAARRRIFIGWTSSAEVVMARNADGHRYAMSRTAVDR
jgi:hypothetical protein